MTSCPIRLFAAGIILCALALNVAAQTNAPESFPYMKETPPSAEDIEWKALLEARKADELEFAQLPAQASARAAAIGKRAAKSVKAADRAKGFYEKHPHHSQAGEARRLEILSLLQNEADEGENLNGRLDKAVAALRSDTKVSATTRALGAAAYEFSRAHRAAKNEPARRKNVESAARQLAAEFPAEAPGYQALLVAARLSNVAQGETLAREIVNAATAPKELKAQAQILIDRASLLGRPLADVLGDSGAELLAQVNQAQAKIVYSWATWAPSSVELGKMIQIRQLPAIAVCLDDDVERAQTFRRTAGLGGVQVFDPQGRAGAIAQLLKFDAAGHVYIVDEKGIIREVQGGVLFEHSLTTYGVKSTIPKPAGAH